MAGKTDDSSSNETTAKDKAAIYEYLPPSLDMRSSLELMNEESATEKFTRKFLAEPLVPCGCLFTAGALTYGLIQMKTGNRHMSQRMMRLRILAQGFTVMACLAGVFYTAKKKRVP